MKKFLKVLIIVLALSVIFKNAVAMERPYSSKPAILNIEATDFSLYDLDGKKVALSDFKNKNNIMLFFWATWCHFCRAEIIHLNGKHDELKEKEIVVLAIDVDEAGAMVRKFLANKPISYRILLDKGAKVAFDYGLNGVPTYILINKKGIVRSISNEFPKNYEEIFSD